MTGFRTQKVFENGLVTNDPRSNGKNAGIFQGLKNTQSKKIGPIKTFCSKYYREAGPA